MNVNIIDLK